MEEGATRPPPSSPGDTRGSAGGTERNWDGEVVGPDRKKIGILTGDRTGTTDEHMIGGPPLHTETNRVREANEDWSRTSGDQEFLRKLSNSFPLFALPFTLAFGDDETRAVGIRNAAMDAACAGGSRVILKGVGKAIDKGVDATSGVSRASRAEAKVGSKARKAGKRADNAAKKSDGGCFVAGTQVVMASVSEPDLIESDQDDTSQSSQDSILVLTSVVAGIYGFQVLRTSRIKRKVAATTKANDEGSSSRPDSDDGVFSPLEEYERERLALAYPGDTSTRPLLLKQENVKPTLVLPERTESATSWKQTLHKLVGCACLTVNIVLALLIGSTSIHKKCPETTSAGVGTSMSNTPVTKSIEDIRVGDRVIADSPTGEIDDTLGNDVDPDFWRKLTLRAEKADGTVANIVLLRPLWWLTASKARVGGVIQIAVPECGIDGNVNVLSIDPCPSIQSGTGKIVTGTYKHSVRDVFRIHVDGMDESIGVTANHPFWNETKKHFVRADELQVGDSLNGLSRQWTVKQVEKCDSQYDVFNLEVQTTHVYRVSESGILVHNSLTKGCDDWAKKWAGRKAGRKMLKIEGKKGGANYYNQATLVIPKDEGRRYFHHVVGYEKGKIADELFPRGTPIGDWLRKLLELNGFRRADGTYDWAGFKEIYNVFFK